VDILSVDPVDLQHPSWCAAQSCTAPDRVAERGQDGNTIPASRRGSHFGEAHIIPTSRISEVQFTLELFRDVYAEVTDEPDGVLLSYASELCGHAGRLILTGEQTGPLATAAAAMRDAMRTDRNPVVDEVAQALRVLGCITRGNADALLSLTVVHLTDRERTAVLAHFPAGEVTR
jgi:hypothetical protein